MSNEPSAQLGEQHTALQSASWNPAFRPEDDESDSRIGIEKTSPSNHERIDADATESADIIPETSDDSNGHVTQSKPSTDDAAVHSGLDIAPASGLDTAQDAIAGDDDFFENLNHQPNVQSSELFAHGDAAIPARSEQAEVWRQVDDGLNGQEDDRDEEVGAHVLSAPSTKSAPFHEGSDLDSFSQTKSLDPDTFDMLQHLDRSSSFPDVVPHHEPHRLPSTQAETILEEAEADQALLNGNEVGNTAYSEDVRLSSGGPQWFDEPENPQFGTDEVSFFDKVNQQEDISNEPTDAEARFEEGLPLVSESIQEKPNPPPQSSSKSLDDFFGANPTAEETSFFDQGEPQGETLTEEPWPLERKDTNQVLSSMHLATHGAKVDREVVPSTEASQHQAQEHSKPAGEDFAKQENLDAMWKEALADDEFLVEDDDGFLSDSSNQSRSSFLDQLKSGADEEHPPAQNMDQYRPLAQRSSASYTPHQPSTSEMFSTGTWGGGPGLSHSGLPPANVATAFPQQQRPAMAKAESFVDQARGGYKSPYDLPDDLSVRPRKRVQMQPSMQNIGSTAPPPPPRSSSMASDQAFSPLPGQNFQPPPKGSWSRPSTASGAETSHVPTPASPEKSGPKTLTKQTSFFEELPMASKPRPPTAQGRYAPPQTSRQPSSDMGPAFSSALGQSQPSLDPRSHVPQQAERPVLAPPVAPHAALVPHTVPSVSTPPSAPISNPYANLGLQKPERLDPFANIPQQTMVPPTIPTSTRYSPAPVLSQPGPRISPSPRYSPAPPPSQTASRPQNQYASQPPRAPPFQPRASSPLAHHEKSTSAYSSADGTSTSVLSPPTSPPTKRLPSMSYAQHVEAQRKVTPLSTEVVRSASFAPPRRSQTQSPGRYEPFLASSSSQQPAIPRPASVQGPSAPIPAAPTFSATIQQVPGRSRGLSQSANFISPTDATQFDELQRWRGSPIFHFTPGGAIVSNFPKHIPRYTAGQTLPMIKPTPGQVQVRNAKDVLDMDSQAARFPGPLRTKSKKKDLLTWLSDRISILEQAIVSRGVDAQLPDPQTCHDEKVLLWQVLKVFVEHDGVVEGKPEAQKSLTALLSPGSSAAGMDSMQLNTVVQEAGIYGLKGSQIQPEPVDPSAVEQIRKNLVTGEREKAVWEAVDRRLWSHAMLIASTLDKSVWKQVVQEFVRREVKTIGENTESLAALYQIFGGNLEDSIDELVPPSARAGLQMVSKVTSSGPTKNALDGLNKWRQTLSLVINNRSPDDSQAISALGRLLMTYSRIEAAHICFILSKTPPAMLFGGNDDPQSTIVLLGANHKQTRAEICNDEDAILLTEIYEYATSVLATNASSSASLPHLQAYKLQRAIILAEKGHKQEAMQYCDAIGSSLKSSTKMSPYYHSLFITELDELANRLRQAPVDSSSSWKPSVEKMSGSLLSRFNSFVTGGEDSDATSTGSGKDANHENGPFAKIVGTPTISREQSQADLYSSYASGGNQSLPVSGGSGGGGGGAVGAGGGRYAPNNHYTPRSSSELGRSSSLFLNQSQQKSPSLDVTSTPYAPTSSPYAPQQSSYEPTPVFNPQTHEPNTALPQPVFPPAQVSQSYQPTPPPEQPSYSPQIPVESQHIPAFGGYQPTAIESAFTPHQSSPPEEQATHESSTEPLSYNGYGGGYEPPSMGSGYVPYVPEPDSDGETGPSKNTTSLPKKPSIMDLDDDMTYGATTNATTGAPQPPTTTKPVHKDLDRAKRDADADAAFRAAAEADAKRGSQEKTLKSKGSGWFGGWFGGKPEDGGINTSEPKVIRAKLGEESSFYYDKELKKWVNKKDPGSATASAKATPPPPRSAPRSVSSIGGAVGGPPPANLGPGLSSTTSLPSMGPPPASRSDSPAYAGGPPPAGLSAGPPPSMSGRSTPAALPKSSSGSGGLDDLLGMGPPVPRAPGGTAKAKKKRGGYVDVMAQQGMK